MSDKFTMVDLFSGVGGLSLGFADAGFEVVAGNDVDGSALAAFGLNHPRAALWAGSITELNASGLLDASGMEPGELDVLAGGPPCQGFSKNRARSHVAGQFIHDPRNHLFRDFLRFIEIWQPKVAVIENVPEILSRGGGVYVAEISDTLNGLGYEVTASVLNAADFGVPQLRKRAVFVASRHGAIPLPAPSHTRGGLRPYVTVRDAIGDLAGLVGGTGESPSKYPAVPASTYQMERRHDADTVTGHVAWQLSDIQSRRLNHLGEGDGWDKLPKSLQPKTGYGSAYRRMSYDAPALTITTQFFNPGSGMFFHPSDHRTITLREAARLQSFDDNVQFFGTKTAQCKQVGNAVPPLLAEAVGHAVAHHLEHTRQTSRRFL